MKNEENIIRLAARLDEARSKKEISRSIKELEKKLGRIRLVASLYKGDSQKELNAAITAIQNNLRKISLRANLDSRLAQREVDKALHEVSIKDIPMDEHGVKLQARKLGSDIRAIISKNTIPVNLELKKEKLNNQLTSFLAKNSKISTSSALLKEADELRDLIGSIDSSEREAYANERFKVFRTEVTATGYAAKSTTDKISGLMKNIGKLGSLFSVAGFGMQKYKESMNTLRDMSSLLTEISRVSQLTDTELQGIMDDSFGIASKYGKSASDYLNSVKEMAAYGYTGLAKELAELSLLAQSAGLTAEAANGYIQAADAAYGYGGSIEYLTSVLDGASHMSHISSAALSDIADATRISASCAADAGVGIDQLTAAETAMLATTRLSGSEVGSAFHSILLNLQQISGELENNVIHTDQLDKVVARCRSLGIELKSMSVQGKELSRPMEILKELALVYHSLPDGSADQEGLIADLGGKDYSAALTALLRNWSLYEKLLEEFSRGSGSSLKEAGKTADAWNGRLISLQNTWDSFIHSITNQEYINTGLTFTENLIKGFEALSDKIIAIPVLISSINGVLAAMNKNYGITQLFNADKKIDIQGNLFGIDITGIKAQKKHFKEAAEAIYEWNNYLVSGKSNINDLELAIVKNNTQFKEYLLTCSKDAPASLAGYKSYLNAAGVATDSLRLKTVLLTSAISLGISLAIQLLVTIATKAIAEFKTAEEKADSIIDTYETVTKEITSLNSELKTTAEKIDELNAKANLSLVEAEELEKLKATNSELERELRVKEALAKVKGGEANKAAVKYFSSQPQPILGYYHDPALSNRVSNVDLNLELVKSMEKGMAETDNKDSFLYKFRENELNSLKESISKDIAEFMEKDDYLIAGKDGGFLEKLESLYRKYDEIINGVAVSKENTIKGVLDKVDFQSNKDSLIQLASAGDLSIDQLTSDFAELTGYLEAAGVSTQELYQYLMNLANPDTINYDEAKEQLYKSLGYDSAGEELKSSIDQQLHDLDLLSTDALEAYLVVKAKYTDEGTEYWTKDDWLHAIQSEIESNSDAAAEINYPFAFDKLGNISKTLSDVEAAYQAASDALDEYNEKGALSMSTLDSVIGMENDYINALLDSNGQITFSQENIDSLRRIKLEAAKASLYQEACEELVRLKALDVAVADNELALANGTLTSSAYKTAKALYEQVAAMGGSNKLLADDVWRATNAKIKLIDQQIKNIKTGASEMNQTLSSASGSSSDPLKDAFTREYNALKHNLDMQYITEEQYYNSLDALNQKYFAGREQYLEDYRKYEEESCNGLLKYYKSYLDNQMGMLENALELSVISYQDYTVKVSSMLSSMYEDGKISDEDYYDSTKKMLEKQLSIHDKALSAVTRRLDGEIDKNQDLIDGLEKENKTLEAQIDKYDSIVSAVQKSIDTKKGEIQTSINAVEKENDGIKKQIDNYNSVISAVKNVYEAKQEELKAEQDAIQERIDALREENDENQKAMELQKARYELERSMNQRTKLVFNGEQFVYMADHKAVAENREKLGDLELEETISAMEKEKEALQELTDELERYKNMWAGISDSAQKDKDDETAGNILGENYKQDVLLNRPEDIEAFRDRYLEAQTRMDDNTSLIDSYEEKLLYYDSLKPKWEELGGIHEDNINRQLAIEQFGSEWETLIHEDRLPGFEEFKNSYLSIQDKIDDNTGMIDSYHVKIEYYQKLKEQWNSIADTYEQSMEDQYASMLLGQNWEADVLSGRIDNLNQFKNDYVNIQRAMAQADIDRYNAQVEASRNAAAQVTTANASLSNGTDITGSYRKSSSPLSDRLKEKYNNKQRVSIKKFASGGIISDAASNSLDWLAEKSGEDHIIIGSNHERVLTESQNKLFEKLLGMTPAMVNVNPLKDLPTYTFPTPEKEKSVSLNIGEINMNNVQDVDGFARAIERELPLTMLQLLHTR